MIYRSHLTLAALVFVPLTGACTTSVAGPPPPLPAVGAAIMDWTIDGTKDPSRCAANGAQLFHVTLAGSGGRFAGEFVQSCTAFATTIGGLAADTYTGDANLLSSPLPPEGSGTPRTTTIALAPFGIAPGATTTVAMDFPSSSFF